MTIQEWAGRALGERNLGRLGYLLRLATPDVWGGPFNGQAFRTRIFNEIMAALPIQALVETGTFRGTTTELLAAVGRPVYTVEARPRNAGFAQARLWRQRHVHLSDGDSRAFLRRLAADPSVPRSDVFFYLDAHWEDDLPLAEEMDLALRHWPRAVVMVDDFEVPGTAYTFDDYGPGKALTLGYLAPVLARHGAQAFFPAVGDADETGARRGSVVVCADPDVARTLAALPSLRPA